MPETVSLRLAYYPPCRTRRNCHQRCATASTLTILASRSYTRMRTTRTTTSLPDMGCRCSCRMGSGTHPPDARCFCGEHWRPVQGVEEWAVAIDFPSSDEAPAQLRHRLVTTPVNVRGGHIAEIRAGARPRPPARVVAGSRGSDERPHCNLYGVGRRISRKLLARHWGPAPSVKRPLFVSQCTVIPQSL